MEFPPLGSPPLRAESHPTPHSIRELLHHIFCFADDNTLATSARVCRAWFECAIQLLWEDVRLLDTMALLAPVQWNMRRKSNVSSSCMVHSYLYNMLRDSDSRALITPGIFSCAHPR
jgi:hypothetical protein